MNTTSNANTVSGIIEHRNGAFAVHIPIAALLTLDAMSYAIARVEANRREATNTDFTAEERSVRTARADALNRWIDSGCVGTVPFAVDVQLYARSGFGPAVVMAHNLDTYLDQVLGVSTIVPLDQMDAPQFALRANQGEPELWLTDARTLRNARNYAGADVRVVDVTVDDLKELIASQQTPRMFMAEAMAA